MKLLMHMCCGPCSCYPLKKLRSDGIEPTGYFFNPNIHPYKEWEERLQNARKFANLLQMEFIADETSAMREFLKTAFPAEGTKKGRCRMCYTWRLKESARYAAEHGFDSFTSTLFYSILPKNTEFHFTMRISVSAGRRGLISAKIWNSTVRPTVAAYSARKNDTVVCFGSFSARKTKKRNVFV